MLYFEGKRAQKRKGNFLQVIKLLYFVNKKLEFKEISFLSLRVRVSIFFENPPSLKAVLQRICKYTKYYSSFLTPTKIYNPC